MKEVIREGTKGSAPLFDGLCRDFVADGTYGIKARKTSGSLPSPQLPAYLPTPQMAHNSASVLANLDGLFLFADEYKTLISSVPETYEVRVSPRSCLADCKALGRFEAPVNRISLYTHIATTDGSARVQISKEAWSLVKGRLSAVGVVVREPKTRMDSDLEELNRLSSQFCIRRVRN